MKIGIVTEYHYPTIGGIQDHVHFFHAELVRMGYDAVVITSHAPEASFPPGEAVADPGRVVRVGRSRVFPANGSAGRITTGGRLVADFRAVLAAERCDLLHVHTPFVPTLPMLALKEARVPVVGTFHTNFAPDADGFIKRFLPLMREYLRRLDARIAVSATSAALMRETFGGEYHVIPNGVDVRGFSAGRPHPVAGDDALTLLFVGRLDPRNGLDEMLAAAALAAERTPLRLLVMGDGDLRGAYERRARRLLGERAIFLGTRLAGKVDWYATADVLCAPMHVASFGLILLEAMAAGKAIIANRIAGFSDVMTDAREGLFVDTRDTRAFAAAITALGASPERRRRLGAAGRRRAAAYAWERVAPSIVDVYRETLGLAGVLKRRRA